MDFVNGVSNFHVVKEDLSLGLLSGGQFRMALPRSDDMSCF
jgi:hypothetical protein